MPAVDLKVALKVSVSEIKEGHLLEGLLDLSPTDVNVLDCGHIILRGEEGGRKGVGYGEERLDWDIKMILAMVLVVGWLRERIPSFPSIHFGLGHPSTGTFRGTEGPKRATKGGKGRPAIYPR